MSIKRVFVSAIGGGGLAACFTGPVTSPEPVATSHDGIAMLATAPPDALVLRVRAIRWSCNVTHANDVETSDLRVPVGRPIKLSVWTPEWPDQARGLAVSLGTAIHKPVVKGSSVEIAFRIDKPGTYHWKCPTLVPDIAYRDPDVPESSEAIAQRNPVKPLTAMPAADYDALVAANDPSLPTNRIALGRALYERKGCNACHTIDGSARVGPSWKAIWDSDVKLSDGTTRRVDEAYVRESILHPQAFARSGYPPVMPTFEGQLKERELAALVGYIESLK